MINKDLVIKNLNYEWCGENGTYSFDGVTFSIQDSFLNMYNGKQGKLVSYDTVLNRTDELKKDITRIFNVNGIFFNAFIDDLVDILKHTNKEIIKETSKETKYNKQVILNKLNKFGWRKDISSFLFEKDSEDKITVTLFDDYFEISKKRLVHQLRYDNYVNCASYWNNKIEQDYSIKLNDYYTLKEFLESLVDVIRSLNNTKSLDNRQNNIPKRYLTKSGKNFIDILKNEMLADEEFKGFVKGCMLKYIFRYENKGGLEDLKKADNYLKMLEDIERGNDND